MTGDKFISELHLKQPRFTYSSCGPFTKHHERIQKFREPGNIKHSYKNILDKACLPHYSAYSYSKNVAKKLFQIRFWKVELM